MRRSEIYFVSLPGPVLGVALQAAQQAFPGSRIIMVDHLDEVLQSRHADGVRLLVLANAAAVAATSQVTDTGGSPRWAMVVLGNGSSELAETVAPEDWNVPLLARVFRSALLQHELLCENLQLRGDLKTVARRISHDLRTPTGCIHTTSDVLPELDAASLAGMSAVIRQSSQEIFEIIERVSFVLKASADPLPSAPVEMGLLVDAALRQLKPDITNARAIVKQPADWPTVDGVTSWLQVIWWNLLHNSLRHGGPETEVRIGWERESGGCRFSISDRGAGIPSERQAGLFLPFDQLHVTPGTGLGLPIVQRLVALQGGHCSYENTPEGGACFSFILPAAASAV